MAETRKIHPHVFRRQGGERVTIREARSRDAQAIDRHLECISKETDFLTFGPDDLTLDEAEQQAAIRASAQSAYDLWTVAAHQEALEDRYCQR
jgi:hypothetical protein